MEGWDQDQHPCEFYDLGMAEEPQVSRGKVAGFQTRSKASTDPHAWDAHIKTEFDGKRPDDVTDDPER